MRTSFVTWFPETSRGVLWRYSDAEASANFEELDADEKEIALIEKDKAMCAKAYEIARYLINHDAYTARWETYKPVRELFFA